MIKILISILFSLRCLFADKQDFATTKITEAAGVTECSSLGRVVRDGQEVIHYKCSKA